MYTDGYLASIAAMITEFISQETEGSNSLDDFLKYDMRDWLYKLTTTRQREFLFGNNQDTETHLFTLGGAPQLYGHNEVGDPNFFDSFLMYDMRDWFYKRTTIRQREFLFENNQDAEDQFLAFFVFIFLYKVTLLDTPAPLIGSKSRPFFDKHSLSSFVRSIYGDDEIFEKQYNKYIRSPMLRQIIREMYREAPKTNKHELTLLSAYRTLTVGAFMKWGHGSYRTLLDASNTTHVSFEERYDCYQPFLNGFDNAHASKESDPLTNEIGALFLRYIIEVGYAPEITYQLATFFTDVDAYGIRKKPKTSLCEEKIIHLLLRSKSFALHEDLLRIQSMGYIPVSDYFKSTGHFDIILLSRFIPKLSPDSATNQEAYDKFFDPLTYDRLFSQVVLSHALLESSFQYMSEALKEAPKDKLILSVHTFLKKHYDTKTLFCAEKVWSRKKVGHARALLDVIKKV